MRFLFNSSFYWPAYQMGGPIYSVAGLAEELVRRGHRVTVLVCDRDVEKMDVDLERGAERNGVRVRYFEASPTLLQRTGIPAFAKSGAYRFGPEFHRWVRANVGRFDVVHSQISFLYSSAACSREARRRGKVYLYNQRGNLDPVRLRRGWLKKRVFIELIEKPIMRRADALIALTDYEAGSYRALGCRQRIEVIPNGIDPGWARRPEASRVDGAMRATLERLGDRPAFLFMSRIHPTKGPELFAEAFARLAAEDPEPVALVAGVDEVGLLAESVLPRMRQAGLAERFLYVGPARGDTKLALLRRADALVLPTLSEGFSMAVLEAMACGCAVLTTPGAHFPDIAAAGAGLLVERTAEGILGGLRAMAADGRRLPREMGERARRLIHSKYSWSVIAERYEELCRELRAGRAGAE